MWRLIVILASVASASAALTQEQAMLSQWPPREFLLKSLTGSIEATLKTQDPATGRFGTKPWICSDQNVLLPLAAAWAIEDPANPWYHDERLLAAIAKGGEALVDDQDPKGMWTFRKKDNSTWGQIHMPWTYSRWIRAYVLVKDALPAASREKWEKGLLLGFTGIRRYANGRVHNIPTHHAMGLYIAGTAFANEDWKQAATKFMHRAVAEQDPGGFWSENFGPVVGYNEVYVDALGAYYHFSKDPEVLAALQRSARFHSSVLWPDGSSVACIDERQVYHAGVEIGNVGFTWTPEGRGFLQRQMSLYMKNRTSVNADYAASILLYGGTGEAIMPAAAADQAMAAVGENDALVSRHKPWQWALSAYACPVPRNRWIQDRHNLVDIYHDDVGLIVGGGNTKLQPYWSTFTVGDCSLLRHDGSENPEFLPDIPLRWVPDSGEIVETAGTKTLALQYGDHACRVTLQPQPDENLKLTYEAPADQGVEAHVPFLRRGQQLHCASGLRLRLNEEDVLLTSEQVGDWFVYGGMLVNMPPGASLRWPVRQHNPYTKDGHSSLDAAKLVLCLPFDKGRDRHEVTLALQPQEKFEGLVFEARDLPNRVTADGYTKRLDDLGSQLLGTRQPGAALTFTLPEIKPGRYELLGDFIMASMYGIVQVSVNGQPSDKTFDAWCPGVDREGERVNFGVFEIKQGQPEIELKVRGKHEQSTGYLVSVKRWLLRPVK